jgi:hypothetical protein
MSVLSDMVRQREQWAARHRFYYVYNPHIRFIEFVAVVAVGYLVGVHRVKLASLLDALLNSSVFRSFLD